MTSKVAKLHALFDNSWAFHVLRFWNSRDAEKASNKGFCEETATVAMVQTIFEMPWGVKLWGFVGFFWDFSMRSFAAFAAASMKAFCWAKRWVKDARLHVLLAKSWARNSPIDLQKLKSWRIWWCCMVRCAYDSYLFVDRKGLPLLDTSHHGWHLSKMSPSTAKAGTFSTLPLSVEGNGLQQRSGAGRLPLQRCKAPCKIWKRLSKTGEKLTGISVSPRILRWNIPKWRSKTVRFFSLYCLSSVFFIFVWHFFDFLLCWPALEGLFLAAAVLHLQSCPRWWIMGDLCD